MTGKDDGPVLPRQMIGGALYDLARRIEPQIFANLRSPLVLIKHRDAVGADIGVDQLEMQIGYQRQRLGPIRPNVGLAAQGSAAVEAEFDDDVGRHLEILDIERQHAIQIARIPRRNPFASQRRQIFRLVSLVLHDFLPEACLR
jgi:hypothetical protein